MIHTASPDDSRIAEYRHVADHQWLRRAGLFVAEGRLVVRRLLPNPRFRTRSVLVSEAALESMRDLLTDTPVEVFVVDQPTMNDVAGFNIHRGCLALAERPAARALTDVALDGVRRLAVLENVNNPDNVGGIFRSAAAFGTDAIVLGPACSDPLYRKSIRTSMAATLVVPFFYAEAWPDTITSLRARGFRVVAMTPAIDAVPLDHIPRELAPVAVLVGAEGEGLTSAALAAADLRVRVPMSDRADSLNVTVAASIALYHFAI